ncbi:MAG: tRNA pseudouridine(38-40) synthase TruA [Candidatus Aureabacteria bacterium]|nr:tRNA pseudouridine(38-40) synthase TruA [Candidatus Auribacterota bacterium]
MAKNELRNIKLTIEYDGTDFFGWQVQPGCRTVQGEIEGAVEKLTGEFRRVFASGRTDAGVHALGQTAHFHTTSSIPGNRFAMALNAFLPDDVVILSSKAVPLSFHARKSAKGKHYRYVIYNRRVSSPLRRRQMHCVYEKLDILKMRKAAELFVGKKNFASFASNARRKDDPVRSVTDVRVTKKGPVVTIDVMGRSFLYKMVRAISGTLVEIGRGKELDIVSIFRAQRRVSAGPNLPACGLYLVRVIY